MDVYPGNRDQMQFTYFGFMDIVLVSDQPFLRLGRRVASMVEGKSMEFVTLEEFIVRSVFGPRSARPGAAPPH